MKKLCRLWERSILPWGIKLLLPTRSEICARIAYKCHKRPIETKSKKEKKKRNVCAFKYGYDYPLSLSSLTFLCQINRVGCTLKEATVLRPNLAALPHPKIKSHSD